MFSSSKQSVSTLSNQSQKPKVYDPSFFSHGDKKELRKDIYVKCAFDNRYEVNDEMGVVAIMRKPESNNGGNPEHAFLVVQTVDKDRNIVVFWRYDLFVDENNSDMGTVAINNYVCSSDTSQKDHHSVFWNEVVKKAQTCHIATEITPKQQRILHERIEESRDHPPRYFISGNQSLIGKSISKSGENCFTWARSHLLAIFPEMESQLTGGMDIIVAKTSSYILSDDTSPDKKTTCVVM